LFERLESTIPDLEGYVPETYNLHRPKLLKWLAKVDLWSIFTQKTAWIQFVFIFLPKRANSEKLVSRIDNPRRNVFLSLEGNGSALRLMTGILEPWRH
jgi:hypothetical protein